MDTGLANWCAFVSHAHGSPITILTSPTGRKQILDSKSHKRLQELNLALDKLATELDDERTILGDTLQDYSGGMVLERALYEVCTELAALEAQDVVLRQRIEQETEKLCQLEGKVRQISGCYLIPLG